MTMLVRAAIIVTLILLVTPVRGGPHGLSTRVVEGPAGAHAMQMTPDRPRAVAQSLPSGFLMPSHGNFQAQPLDRTKPMYVPSFQSPISVPWISQPSAGQLTRTGTAHKEFGLRQMSIDPAARTPATITAGEVSAAIRSAPERSTRLSPGLDPQRPRPSYGPQWLTVEVENTPATPESALQPGLQK